MNPPSPLSFSSSNHPSFPLSDLRFLFLYRVKTQTLRDTKIKALKLYVCQHFWKFQGFLKSFDEVGLLPRLVVGQGTTLLHYTHVQAFSQARLGQCRIAKNQKAMSADLCGISHTNCLFSAFPTKEITTILLKFPSHLEANYHSSCIPTVFSTE